jgi:hypothetical protein
MKATGILLFIATVVGAMVSAGATEYTSPNNVLSLADEVIE